MSIHGLAECDPLPKSVTDINGFWKTNCYLINGHVFSLDDIEHGILRGKYCFLNRRLHLWVHCP